jgi:RNA recognition motif-containing protein
MLGALPAAILRNPWMPMVQLIMVNSNLTTEPQQAKSNRTQNRARKAAGFGKGSGEENAQKDLTTVMMRNLPVELTRDMLLQLLNDRGFAGDFNFVYMPIDFVKKVGLGYAFVNLSHNDVAPRFWRSFDRFDSWPVCSTKVCRLGWSSPHQGLQNHVERYRNSPLMHKDVPDSIRPALFENGVRIAFPPPTKALKAPRLRASHRCSEFWKKD